MAKTAALNEKMIGFNLVNGATKWRESKYAGQDLLLIVGIKEDGQTLPYHKGAWGTDVAEDTDMSCFVAAYENTGENWNEAVDMFPTDLYAFRHGVLRGNVLTVKA